MPPVPGNGGMESGNEPEVNQDKASLPRLKLKPLSELVCGAHHSRRHIRKQVGGSTRQSRVKGGIICESVCTK